MDGFGPVEPPEWTRILSSSDLKPLEWPSPRSTEDDAAPSERSTNQGPSQRPFCPRGHGSAPFSVSSYADLAVPILENQPRAAELFALPYLGTLNDWPNELAQERKRLKRLNRHLYPDVKMGAAAAPHSGGEEEERQREDGRDRKMMVASTSYSIANPSSSPFKQRGPKVADEIWIAGGRKKRPAKVRALRA